MECATSSAEELESKILTALANSRVSPPARSGGARPPSNEYGPPKKPLRSL
jgi:hypothetical protein